MQRRKICFSTGEGEIASPAEEREDDALAEEVHQCGAFVVALRVEDQLEEPLDDRRRSPESASVGERPLAEDLGVPGLVHHLGAKEHLGLDEVVVDPPQPLGREVGRHHLDLREHGRELAHGVLEVGVERGELAPRDVAGRAPLAAHGLLVEVHHVVRPDLGLVVDGVAEIGDVRVDVGAPWRHGPPGRVLGDLAVAADGDVPQGQARLARLRVHAPLGVGRAQPAEVELPPGRTLEVLEIQAERHRLPPRNPRCCVSETAIDASSLRGA